MLEDKDWQEPEARPGELQQELDAMMQLAKEKATRWDVIYEKAGLAGEQAARHGIPGETHGVASELPPSFMAQQQHVWFLLQIAARLGRDLARLDDRLTRLERKMRTFSNRRI